VRPDDKYQLTRAADFCYIMEVGFAVYWGFNKHPAAESMVGWQTC
jgi:hypothetical protein